MAIATDMQGTRIASAFTRRMWEVSTLVERSSPRRLALLLYLFALVVSLGFGFITHFRDTPGLLEADEAEYVALAGQILQGTWELSPRRTLAFPALIAAVMAATDSFIALQVVVSAIYATSIPLLFLLTRKLAESSMAGVLAATALMLWPTAVFYGTSLYSETLALPVFLAALVILPAGSRVREGARADLRTCVVAGLVLGLAAHVRPMYLLFLPVMLIILLLEERRIGTALARFAAALAGFLLVVLPWSVYMSDRFDRTIILSANGGETLAGGLSPRLLTPAGQQPTPVYGRDVWVGPGKWLPLEKNGYLSDADLHRPYHEIDGLLQRRALDWVVANPADAIRLEASKLGYMWGVYPLTGNGLAQTLFGNYPTMFLLVLTLALLFREPTTRTRFARLWTLALFVSGVALISWGSWRFRQPADAGLLAFCAAGLWTRYAARPKFTAVAK